jgi:hypothetical protein
MTNEWTIFCKRTEDPKLRYIESRLDELGIPHRRNGESWHAPILEVPAANHPQAYGLLLEVVDNDEQGNLIRLDNIEDDDPMFDEYLGCPYCINGCEECCGSDSERAGYGAA